MKILVIGGTGQVGSHVIRALVAAPGRLPWWRGGGHFATLPA